MPRSRGKTYLAAPPRDPEELRRFPHSILRAGKEVHRIHSVGLAAWYFGADDAWRFNPCAVPNLGACYLAERAVAGLLETYKGVTVVAEEDLAVKAHFTATLERDVRLANCCVRAAGAFDVNGEIHTTSDYALTQAWAGALASAGFEGIRYFCRSDPAMGLVGYALFDTAGVAPPGRWPAGRDAPVDESIVREAEEYGLRVRPTP